MSRARYILWMLMVCAINVAWGQIPPERHHVRKGNRLYEEQRMEEAQREYREALQVDSLSGVAKFNLGDSQYAMGNFEAAEDTFKGVVERDKRLSPEQKAKAYYNLGNAQFQQQKLEEALESYKESLRLNPNDLEAKFNYAYTKAMLENQQNQDQQQNQNQNQDKNQQQQQQKESDDQNQESEEQQQQSDNNEQPEEKPEEPEEEKPEPSDDMENEPREVPEPSMESEQMLDAVQAAEDKTRDKVDAERAVGVARSGKNW